MNISYLMQQFLSNLMVYKEIQNYLLFETLVQWTVEFTLDTFAFPNETKLMSSG